MLHLRQMFRHKHLAETSIVKPTIIISVGLLLLASYAARLGFSATEVSLFYTVYRWPAYLGPFMMTITLLGSTWMVAVVTLTLFAAKKLSLSAQILGAALVSYASSELLKQLIARPRPYNYFVDVTARDQFAVGMGYPSGHTAVAVAVGLVLYSQLPLKWRWLVPAVAVAVAISRVYLGVHTPLDVIGGLLVGVIVWCLMLYARPAIGRQLRRLKKA